MRGLFLLSSTFCYKSPPSITGPGCRVLLARLSPSQPGPRIWARGAVRRRPPSQPLSQVIPSDIPVPQR